MNKIHSLTLSFFACAALTVAARAQEIAIPNAGFEDGLKNWSVAAAFQEQQTIREGDAHGGTKTLRIDAIEKQNNPYLQQRITGLEGGATYKFSAWVRAEAAQKFQQAAVKLEFYNAENKNTSGHYGNLNLAGPGAWQRVEVTATADFDTTSVSALLRVYGGAAIFFDDATFEKVKSAPALRITLPRFAVETGKPGVASFELVTRAAHATPLPVTFKLKTPSGVKTIAAQVKKLDERRVLATATLPVLPEGDYELQIESGGQSAETPARVFAMSANRKPKNLTASGVTLWKGKPFFQIGMYHPYQREADYKLLSENGFNAVQGDATSDLNALQVDLERAAKYGLAYDVPLYGGGKVAANLANSLEKVKRFKNHPSILTWKIIDEPDIKSNGGVADEVPAAYRALKAADANHPIELTMADDATLPYWAHFCDIVQIDRYPVPQRPLTDVYDFSINAMKAKQPWQNLTYVLQCGWTPDIKTQPTVAQARSMAYLALAAGAKGIFWYSMREPNWDLTKTPFWPQMKAINAEIQTLSQPILLGRDAAGIKADNAKIYFLAKRHGGKLYLMLTNPETTPQRVAFTIPAVLKARNSQTLAAHRDGGSGAVALTNGKFSLDLGATDSRTLVFDAP